MTKKKQKSLKEMMKDFRIARSQLCKRIHSIDFVNKVIHRRYLSRNPEIKFNQFCCDPSVDPDETIPLCDWKKLLREKGDRFRKRIGSMDVYLFLKKGQFKKFLERNGHRYLCYEGDSPFILSPDLLDAIEKREKLQVRVNKLHKELGMKKPIPPCR